MDYFIWPVIVTIVVGVLAWLVQMAPIPEPFPRIAQFILVAGLVLWLLSYFGVFHLSNHTSQ